MKKTSRILSLLLAILMIVSSVITVAADTEPAQPTTWWKDNAATSFAGGSGTEADPYLISTPAELAYLAVYLEGGALNSKSSKTYFKLTADLDMSAHQWNPVGYTTKARGSRTTQYTYQKNTLNNAVLDGNEKTVYGVKLTATPTLNHTYSGGCALFTKIVDSTVKDLNLEVKISNPDIAQSGFFRVLSASGTDVLATGTGVAALAAGTFGETVISGVNVTVDLDSQNAETEMIFAGAIAYAMQDTVIENCTSNGTIDVSSTNGTYAYASGFLGRFSGESISNVINNASVTATTNSRMDVAGVIANSGAAPAGIGVENRGAINVTVTATTAGSQTYIGGVFGKPSSLREGVENATNKGNITVDLSGTANVYMGGVFGHCLYQTNSIKDFYNSGNITVNVADETCDYRIGGIGGNVSGKESTDETTYDVISLKSCENIGTIKVLYPDAAATAIAELETYVGGIFGRADFAKLYDCINRGDITVKNTVGKMRIGGVAGAVGYHENQSVDACANYGDIILSDAVSNNANTTDARDKWRCVGGILGDLVGPSITNSHNFGVIYLDKAYAPYYIGGITGNVSCSAANTTSNGNTNNADIEVVHGSGSFHRYIGGLHGYNTTSVISIKNGTTSGDLHSNGVGINAYIGGVIAVASGKVSIDNVTVNGDVKMSGASNSTSGTRYVGGAIGAVTGTSNTVSITNFERNGDVIGEGYAATWNVGGVIGYAVGSTTLKDITIIGDVYVPGSSVMYVGGIVGFYNLGATNVFENCEVNGSVTAMRHHGGSGNLAVGGIAGRISNDSFFTGKTLTLKNCVAIGEVSEGSLCGGIVGYLATSRKKVNSSDQKETIMPYTVALKNCISVQSGVKHGLIGSDRADHLIIEGCFADTAYALSYYNQCDDYLLGETLTINGVPMVGDGVSITPETGCYVLEIRTLDKARVNLNGSNDSASLRFDSYVSKASYDKIMSLEGLTLEIGTMVTATENLLIDSVVNTYDKMAALDAITADGEPAKYIITSVNGAEDFLTGEDITDFDDDNYYFAGYVKGISQENFDRDYTAISFAKLKGEDFEMIFYSDFRPEDTERIRNVEQIAKLAFEDRTTVKIDLNGWNYHTEASAENECFIGSWSIYDNTQLARLKAFCNYVNIGTAPEGLSINGVSITEYKIVYAQSPIYKNYGSLTGNTLYDDLKSVTLGHCSYGNLINICNLAMDFDYQTAVRLQQLIKDEYGVELEIVEDASSYESKYEILVGKTNRAKSNTIKISLLTADEFIFSIDDSKLIVCGGSYGATWHALDALEELFGEIDYDDYNLKMAGNLDGEHYMQKIACIGDSITRGSQALPDGETYGGTQGANVKYGSATTAIYFEQFLSYPANLQRYMWKDCVVYNFGRGASTARNYVGNEGNYYGASTQWNSCLETSNQDEIAFDLVFLMHGTNDAGRDGGAPNWNAAQKQDFQNEIQKVMDGILAGSPTATFVMNNAPHGCYGRTESNDDGIRAIQKTTAINLLNMGYDVYHYDMERYTMENLTDDVGGTCGSMSSAAEVERHEKYYNLITPGPSKEGTHPNYRGYNRIARGIEDVVEYLLFDGEKPEYMIDIA